jgi:hypothetical protein
MRRMYQVATSALRHVDSNNAGAAVTLTWVRSALPVAQAIAGPSAQRYADRASAKAQWSWRFGAAVYHVSNRGSISLGRGASPRDCAEGLGSCRGFGGDRGHHPGLCSVLEQVTCGVALSDETTQ